jgi:flagellar hook-associated protein 1 FlgK
VSNLFTTLTSASRALDAQRLGLDVVGQNIANVNTPGYARRAVDLASAQPDSPFSSGRGVDVTGVRALRDDLLEARLDREVPLEARDAIIADALGVVEVALGRAGESLDAALGDLFDAFGTLAESPVSAVARQEVLLDASSLASAFQDMSARFEAARVDADLQVRAAAREINALAGRIASLNGAIASANGDEATLQLYDDLSVALRELSALAAADVRARPGGGADVNIGQGRPLVVGTNAYAVDIASTPPTGLAALSLAGETITTEVTAGRLGGLLHVRDTAVPEYRSRLDLLAAEVVAQVNAAHEAGFDLDGNAGIPLFTFSAVPDDVNGAASVIQLSADIADNGRLIAAAGIAEPADNQAARAIAALRNARVLDDDSATFVDAWAQLVYVVGRDTRAATQERASRAEIVRQVEALRDEVSGVSLDEEAMMLMKFQRAYEANARFFSAIDSVINTLLNTLAR